MVSWFLNAPLSGLLGASTDSIPGIAIDKAIDSILICVPILVIARVGGLTMDDLFIRTGRLKIWLLVGLITFGGFLTLFLLQAQDMGMSLEQLISLAPWTLVFVFSNAFMEELHFRGLLLKPFGELLGPHLANLCIALFFTLMHAQAEYTLDILVFLSVLFILALAWGYVIQKTQSLWGSVLFHAGADLIIIVGVYESYGVI
jgi:membrane protease YdiL (CAAX protease family)